MSVEPIKAPNHLDTLPYDELMALASSKYAKFEEYTPQAKKVEELVKEWTARHDLLAKKLVNPMPTDPELRTEFWGKIDVYIERRNIRNELLTIIELYNTVIIKSAPPILDPATISVLARMKKVEPAEVEKSYKQLFETELDKLKSHVKEIEAVYKKLAADLKELKISAKPLLKICNIAQGFGFPDFLNNWLKREPSFSEAVNARCVELEKEAKTSKVKPPEEKKEKDEEPVMVAKPPSKLAPHLPSYAATVSKPATVAKSAT